jgi:hypothetical protein
MNSGPHSLQCQLTTPDTEGSPCAAAGQNGEEGGAQCPKAASRLKKKTLVEQQRPRKGTDQRTIAFLCCHIVCSPMLHEIQNPQNWSYARGEAVSWPLSSLTLAAQQEFNHLSRTSIALLFLLFVCSNHTQIKAYGAAYLLAFSVLTGSLAGIFTFFFSLLHQVSSYFSSVCVEIS